VIEYICKKILSCDGKWIPSKKGMVKSIVKYIAKDIVKVSYSFRKTNSEKQKF